MSSSSKIQDTIGSLLPELMGLKEQLLEFLNAEKEKTEQQVIHLKALKENITETTDYTAQDAVIGILREIYNREE